jgi:anti-sigma factor RsiW
MSCVELLRTQAFIDGELEEAAAHDAERHLQDCAECQAFVADAAAAGDLMRRHAERHKMPEALRQRIVAQLPANVTPLQRLPRERRSFWLGAGSGGGVTALAAALALFVLLPPSAASLSDALVNAHTGALASGREIQVVSTDHHTVKPWFAGKIAISPPVADFAGQGFTLTGGRTQKVDGQDMAVVVYRHGAHEIDLFVWADRGSPLPGDAVRHGYHLLSWKKGDLDFAALSDVDVGEMETFAQLIRSEPE